MHVGAVVWQCAEQHVVRRGHGAPPFVAEILPRHELLKIQSSHACLRSRCDAAPVHSHCKATARLVCRMSFSMLPYCMLAYYFCNHFCFSCSRRPPCPMNRASIDRSEEHTSELQSLMRISYAV